MPGITSWTYVRFSFKKIILPCFADDSKESSNFYKWVLLQNDSTLCFSDFFMPFTHFRFYYIEFVSVPFENN